jgi:Pyruvate/2-oxoacid:ferredoxin oxidoreductase delta subunit
MTGKTVRGEKIEAFVSAEQRALIPDVTGNEINGLGEEAVRRPSPIYWHPPHHRRPWSPVQNWMLRKSSREVPEIADMNNQLGGRGDKRRAPKAGVRREKSAAEWTDLIKQFALAHEADLVGVTRLKPEWVFEGYEAKDENVVIVGIEMDHAELAAAPEAGSVIEVMRAYNRGTRAARALADWILSQGFAAEPEGGPIAGKFTLIPAALAAGFGELGKHGSIINRRYGSSFRLAGVITDMPLAADHRDDIGVDEFCLNCKLCEAACPPDAIADQKQMVRGTRKWYIDFDKCVPYFNETYGCGICIAICPWSRPGVAPGLTAKMARKRQRAAADNV